MQWIKTIYNYLAIPFAPAPTVTEAVTTALSGFTTVMAELDAAIEQAGAEIRESRDRSEVAWINYIETRDTEEAFQDETNDAGRKAMRVRTALAELLGEAV